MITESVALRLTARREALAVWIGIAILLAVCLALNLHLWAQSTRRH